MNLTYIFICKDKLMIMRHLISKKLLRCTSSFSLAPYPILTKGLDEMQPTKESLGLYIYIQ